MVARALDRLRVRTASSVAADHLRTLISTLRCLTPSLEVVRAFLDREAQREAQERGPLSMAEQFAQEPPAHRAPLRELTGEAAATLLTAAEQLLPQLAPASTDVGGNGHGPRPAV